MIIYSFNNYMEIIYHRQIEIAMNFMFKQVKIFYFSFDRRHFKRAAYDFFYYFLN